MGNNTHSHADWKPDGITGTIGFVMDTGVFASNAFWGRDANGFENEVDKLDEAKGFDIGFPSGFCEAGGGGGGTIITGESST